MPIWDVDLAVAEIRRAHELGHKALVWTSAPESWGFPHFNESYWDKLWATLQELAMPVALHIGGRSKLPDPWEGFSTMRKLSTISITAITSNVQVMANVIFSGVLERFPDLKFISVESGLGWVPYLLETADHQYERQRLWNEGMKLRPSEYFQRSCYVNFWYETTGLALREKIGVDNIMWEADFPHPTSTYPDSRKLVERCLEGIPESECKKMLHENAVRLYSLDEAAIEAAL